MIFEPPPAPPKEGSACRFVGGWQDLLFYLIILLCPMYLLSPSMSQKLFLSYFWPFLEAKTIIG